MHLPSHAPYKNQGDKNPGGAGDNQAHANKDAHRVDIVGRLVVTFQFRRDGEPQETPESQHGSRGAQPDSCGPRECRRWQ